MLFACLQALTEDISTPADIALSALETVIFYGLYKCTSLLLIIIVIGVGRAAAGVSVTRRSTV